MQMQLQNTRSRIPSRKRGRGGAPRCAFVLAACALAAAAAPLESPIDTQVVVTATPLPATSRQLGRNIEHLGTNELAGFRDLPLAHMLETATSVSVSERGASGAQADLSIRGSTFQQVLLTLDGLSISDPQTGHHNMNLPFPPSALAHATVIPGPGSALFGPSAFGGVVDLAPRIPSSSRLRVLSAAGAFDTQRATLTADHVGRTAAHTLSAAATRSDGFMQGADLETWSVWASSFAAHESGGIRLSAGHGNKNMGARDFYGEYPSREKTRVTLVDIAPLLALRDDWEVKAVLRYRRHEDEFILIDDDPSYYRNEHTTDSYAERITLTSPPGQRGRTAVGIERADAVLDSSNLGDRDVSTSSLFAEHRLAGASCSVDIGLRADRHSRWGTEVSPSLALSAPLGEALAWRASLARGIRPPSFTELYYSDPANAGDPDLKPEEAWGAETGLDATIGSAARVSLTAFIRDTRNLIDWVRTTDDEPWQASNIGEATFLGGEAGLKAARGRLQWQASYRYIDIDTDTAPPRQSKYALNAARHDASVRATMGETSATLLSLGARYRAVPSLDRYWLMEARVSRRLGDLKLFANGQNLLDETYQEIPGVPTAGRYVEVGLEMDI